MDKKTIRGEILELRHNIKGEERKVWDKLILNSLINSEIYKKAKSIFIYVSYNDEVDTIEIIKHSLKSNKDIYVPKTYMQEKTMKAVKIHSLDELSVDNYGILEPKFVDKNNIGVYFDLIIMPGVAFDKMGNRIGYGGGYYDKYISSIDCKSLKVALAYNIQVIDKIESEVHDIKVDYIITNENLIRV